MKRFIKPALASAVMAVIVTGQANLASAAGDSGALFGVPAARTELGKLRKMLTDIENVHKGITSTEIRLRQRLALLKRDGANWKRRFTALKIAGRRYRDQVRYHESYCRGTFAPSEYERRERWCRQDSVRLEAISNLGMRATRALIKDYKRIRAIERRLQEHTNLWAASIKGYARAKARFQARLGVAVQHVRILAVRYSVARCRDVSSLEGAHQCLGVIWNRAKQSADQNVPVNPAYKATHP